MCSRGDRVLLHSPTYVGFTGSLENSGYRIVHSPLVRDGEGVWRMDFADMERKLEEHLPADDGVVVARRRLKVAEEGVGRPLRDGCRVPCSAFNQGPVLGDRHLLRPTQQLHILFTDKKIEALKDVLPLMDQAAQRKEVRPLVTVTFSARPSSSREALFNSKPSSSRMTTAPVSRAMSSIRAFFRSPNRTV